MGKTNKDWTSMSDRAIVKSLGEYLKAKRLESNKTQQQLATEAGLNRWTMSQIENGESINLITLIQILRALDDLQLLDGFQVHNQISPIEYAKLQKNKKQRVRNSEDKEESDAVPILIISATRLLERLRLSPSFKRLSLSFCPTPPSISSMFLLFLPPLELRPNNSIRSSDCLSTYKALIWS